MRARTLRGWYTPLPLPLSSSSLSFYTFLWGSLSIYTFLCPLTVMAILTKSRVLFIFIHPKIGIIIFLLRFVYPPSILGWNSNSPHNFLLCHCPLHVQWMSPSSFCSSYSKVLSIQPHLFLLILIPFRSSLRSYFLL